MALSRRYVNKALSNAINVEEVTEVGVVFNVEEEENESETEPDENQQELMVAPLLQPKIQLKDRCRIGFIIFTLFGIGGTVAWNFFINASQYWEYKFRDTNISDQMYDPSKRTVLQVKFESYLSIASMMPNILGIALCILYSSRVSLHSRIVVPLTVVGLLFIPTIIFSKLDTDQWQLMFFVTTLCIAGIMNCCSAYFQGSIFGFAGMMHHRFIKATMNGQAIGGIIASVARILTIIIDTTETVSAIYYFCVALGFVMICIIAYGILLRTTVYEFYLSTVEGHKLMSLSSNSVKTLPNQMKLVLSKIKIHAVSSMMVFIVTLSVFPALATLVVSVDRNSNSPWTGKYFLPVSCFLLFNCGDFCGRCIANWIFVIPRRGIWLLVISLLRIVYIPLFLLCNAHPRTYMPVLLNSDLAYIILICTCSLSNGYLASLCIMNAPKEVDSQYQELAGILMSLIMAIGVTVGALLSNVVVAVL